MRTLKTNMPNITVSPLLVFSLLIFFICLGDAVMSYASPVFIESNTKNAFFMGLIIASSSVAGFAFDIFISEKQWDKNYRFFIKTTVVAAVLFPLSFLILPPTLITFLIGMFIWGAYYEYKNYACFNFINHFLSKDQHVKGWSFLASSIALAYTLGATFTASIEQSDFRPVFMMALVPFAVAVVILHLFNTLFRSHAGMHKSHVKEMKRNTKVEFKILRSLWHKVWPLFSFSFFIMFIDSCFWTIGTLLSEELKQVDKVGALFLAAYMIPPVFAGIFASKMSEYLGKKRTSFVCGFVSALFLIAIGTIRSVPMIVLFVFLMSVFSSISYILHSAVIEDYMSRLAEFGNDIVTVEQMSRSAAYVIGPVFAGFLAESVGYYNTFAVAGLLLASISIACFITVPRKIKMPQTELQADLA